MKKNRNSTPFILIPCVQIRPTGLVIYNQIEWLEPRTRRKTQDWFALSDKPKAYSGDMTKGSIRRLRKAIQLLVAISEWKEAPSLKHAKVFKFRINFITLTLPVPQGSFSDKEIKKEVLEPFLRIARNRYGITNYVWKAEKQENGNLHFHITTDKYFLHSDIRREWNYCLNRLGFVDHFAEKHGHHNPNSTDIHSVQSIHDLAAYMCKYMLKQNKEGHRIEGKLWDCSSNLKSSDNCTLHIGSEESKVIQWLAKRFPDRVKDLDFATFIPLSESEIQRLLSPFMRQEYADYLHRIRQKEAIPADGSNE